MQKLKEFLWMKRSPGNIGETANAIFFSLRNMFTAHFFKPTRRLLGFFKAKFMCSQYFIQWDLTIFDSNQLCFGIKAF